MKCKKWTIIVHQVWSVRIKIYLMLITVSMPLYDMLYHLDCPVWQWRKCLFWSVMPRSMLFPSWQMCSLSAFHPVKATGADTSHSVRTGCVHIRAAMYTVQVGGLGWHPIILNYDWLSAWPEAGPFFEQTVWQVNQTFTEKIFKNLPVLIHSFHVKTHPASYFTRFSQNAG